jgi:hypothetical protein
MGGTSRISREAYVRFCERLGVKFPGLLATPWREGSNPPGRPDNESARTLNGASPSASGPALPPSPNNGPGRY